MALVAVLVATAGLAVYRLQGNLRFQHQHRYPGGVPTRSSRSTRKALCSRCSASPARLAIICTDVGACLQHVENASLPWSCTGLHHHTRCDCQHHGPK